MPGRLIALDETLCKVNGLERWVYAAIGVDGNEVLSMKVYPSRNMLATEPLIRDILKHRDGGPSFAVDGAL
jgi:transposase-like protein